MGYHASLMCVLRTVSVGVLFFVVSAPILSLRFMPRIEGQIFFLAIAGGLGICVLFDCVSSVQRERQQYRYGSWYVSLNVLIASLGGIVGIHVASLLP